MDWKELKLKGNQHYKVSPDEIEPIDLYKSGGMLKDFAICNGIKYLYRNRRMAREKINPDDIQKAIHYCEMLLVIADEEEK